MRGMMVVLGLWCVCLPVWAEEICLAYTAQCLHSVAGEGQKDAVAVDEIRMIAWPHVCGDVRAWRYVGGWKGPLRMDDTVYDTSPQRNPLSKELVCNIRLNGKPATLKATWTSQPVVEDGSPECAARQPSGRAPRVSVWLNDKMMAKRVPLQACRQYRGETVDMHWWRLEASVAGGGVAGAGFRLLPHENERNGPGVAAKLFNLKQLLHGKTVPFGNEDLNKTMIGAFDEI